MRMQHSNGKGSLLIFFVAAGYAPANAVAVGDAN
jgi:hypothetical protein